MLIHLYRISNWLYRHKIPFIPKIIYGLNYLMFNCIVPPQCTIGKNTRFAYHGIGAVIHRDVVIGANCLIGQGVTIGGKVGHSKLPVIGDNVYIAAGARIIGTVNIGNNVVIGAGSVVTKDIPDWCIAAGNPCRVIRKITDADKKKLFREEEIDEEAWNDIAERMEF